MKSFENPSEAEALKSRIPRHEPENPSAQFGIRGWARKLVLAGTILGGSLVAAGCDSDKPGSPDAGKTGTKQVETNKETVDSNKVLNKYLNRIGDPGARAKMPNGNLVMYVNGVGYFELSDTDLEQLAAFTTEESADFHTENRFRVAEEKMLDMQLRDRISKIGERVPVNNLPQNLQEYEQARNNTREQMQNADPLRTTKPIEIRNTKEKGDPEIVALREILPIVFDDGFGMYMVEVQGKVYALNPKAMAAVKKEYNEYKELLSTSTERSKTIKKMKVLLEDVVINQAEQQ